MPKIDKTTADTNITHALEILDKAMDLVTADVIEAADERLTEQLITALRQCLHVSMMSSPYDAQTPSVGLDKAAANAKILTVLTVLRDVKLSVLQAADGPLVEELFHCMQDWYSHYEGHSLATLGRMQ